MLIDWSTVGAQTLNFLVLVWLLKRFLYKPILHAIDEREKRVAAELADAAAKKAEAHQERDEFQHKNEEFDQQRAALMTNATEEAKAERLRLLDEARQAADDLRAKRRDALQHEQQRLLCEITRRTREEVFAITRKTLTELAGASLEERMSVVFAHRLRELKNDAKDGLAKAIQSSSDPVIVRSAFDLPAEQRATIQQVLDETFSAAIQIRFETAPDAIAGIEVTANGQKVAWSIADYLASLEATIGNVVKDQFKAEPKAQSASNPGTAGESK